MAETGVDDLRLRCATRMSCRVDLRKVYPLATGGADKLLRGAKRAELPTKLEPAIVSKQLTRSPG
jgi:hypothetical protein